MAELAGFRTDTFLQRARQAFQCGEIGKADILCRAVLRRAPNNEAAGDLRDEIATALSLRAPPPPTGKNRYLLIKPWGAGFWADVNHTLAQLFIAELTQRIPVVHWGAGSRFNDDADKNAWPEFFQAQSDVTLDDLKGPGFDYYPDKWNAENLAEPRLNLTSGKGSRLPAIALLARPETVVVADFHSLVVDIMAWVMPTRNPLDIYRALAKRHLQPRPEILEAAERFKAERLGNAPYVATHLRGSDKYKEQHELDRINEAYFGLIDRQLARVDGKLFLMTDSLPWLQRFKDRYGERLVHTDCTRSADQTGVHFGEAASRVQLGREVLLDSVIATGAERFIGNGLSATSEAVVILKEWPRGHCLIVGNLSWLDPDTSLFGPQFHQNLTAVVRPLSRRG